MPGYSVTTIRIVSPSGQGNAPTVATAAQASPSTVTGVSTDLSVLGADAGGAANLTYTWSTTAAPAPVTFSVNGTNAAQDTVATFSAAGTYSFLVTITNAGGYFATSSVKVTVDPTLTPHHGDALPIRRRPCSGDQQFTATGTDQFGNALSAPPSYSWSAGAGSITSAGVFTAPAAAGMSRSPRPPTACRAAPRFPWSTRRRSPSARRPTPPCARRRPRQHRRRERRRGHDLFAPSLAGDTIALEPGRWT